MSELELAEIAARIAQARREAGLSQYELGDLLDPPVRYRTIQTWESTKAPRIPYRRLDQIASATGTTKQWLLYGDAGVPPPDALRKIIREELRGEMADVLAALARLEARLAGEEPPPEEL